MVTLLHVVVQVSWFPLYAGAFIWLNIGHFMGLIPAVGGKKKVEGKQFPFKDIMQNANIPLMLTSYWPELSQMTMLSCKGR